MKHEFRLPRASGEGQYQGQRHDCGHGECAEILAAVVHYGPHQTCFHNANSGLNFDDAQRNIDPDCSRTLNDRAAILGDRLKVVGARSTCARTSRLAICKSIGMRGCLAITHAPDDRDQYAIP